MPTSNPGLCAELSAVDIMTQMAESIERGYHLVHEAHTNTKAPEGFRPLLDLLPELFSDEDAIL